MKCEENILFISFYKKVVNVICYVKVVNLIFEFSLEKILYMLYCEFE